MTDIPSIDIMSRPLQEPGLYQGDTIPIPPLMGYDGGQAGNVTVRAGWVAAERRRPRDNCNDSVTVWADPGQTVCLLAVADGVGVEARAGRAARAATALAIQAFRAHWDEDRSRDLETLIQLAFGDLDASLHRQGSQGGSLHPAYRTTVTLAAVPAVVPPGGIVRVAVGRVGDSDAWLVRPGELQPLFGTRDRSRGTPALPGHRHLFESRSLIMADGEVLALTTDGLAAGGAQERAAPFLADMWAAPPTPLDFLRSLSVRRDDRDDDRAAAVAWLGHYEIRNA
ncbi:protein phosphatase 2C domain-containing protein [Thermopolyspora sp. NPDC052614]|uniref:protein phosphatase 2C domain-containing protein n=1 Tax=Thermopolyspora sp. NPDC052614 TaxID=3155682 RepID=UPI00342D896D